MEREYQRLLSVKFWDLFIDELADDRACLQAMKLTLDTSILVSSQRRAVYQWRDSIEACSCIEALDN